MSERAVPRAVPSTGGPVDLLALLGCEPGRHARNAEFEAALLRQWQRDLPLDPEPFARIGEAYGRTGRDVLEALRHLQREGVIAGVGAVRAPAAFGVSTLAAMRVKPGELDAVAGYVSLQSEVLHTDARDHDFNLWFVVSATERRGVDAVLARVREATGLEPLDLPMIEGFRPDPAVEAPHALALRRGPLAMDARRWALLAALESGLPLVPRPYARLGMRAGMSEDQVITQLRFWLDTGALLRLGVIVRAREQDRDAVRAMCVWDVPEPSAGPIGLRAAAVAGVSLCYRRRRVAGRWPYNLYCMIQAPTREAVLRARAEVQRHAGLDGLPGDVLFSTRCFKPGGVRQGAGLRG